MMNRRFVALVAVAIVTPLGLVACGTKHKGTGAQAQPAAAVADAQPSAAAPAGPLSLSISPDKGKANLPVSTEIGLTISNGKVGTVELKGPDGKAVSGAARDDGSSWVPSRPLKPKTKYTATVTAAG